MENVLKAIPQVVSKEPNGKAEEGENEGGKGVGSWVRCEGLTLGGLGVDEQKDGGARAQDALTNGTEQPSVGVRCTEGRLEVFRGQEDTGAGWLGRVCSAKAGEVSLQMCEDVAADFNGLVALPTG